jgi:hypothetical protein
VKSKNAGSSASPATEGCHSSEAQLPVTARMGPVRA